MNMELSKDSVVVIAQIIPVLLLASFLDKDILSSVRSGSVNNRVVALGYILFILFGEILAIVGVVNGGLLGWQGLVVMVAALFAVASMLNVAMYRLFDYDFLSGLPQPKKK